MKKLLLILLLPLSVSATNFLQTNADAYKHIRTTLGFARTATSEPVSDTTLAQFLREGIVTVGPLIGHIKAEEVLTTTYNVNKYTLDTTNIRVHAVWFQKNDSIKFLHRLPMSEWANAEHKNTKGKTNYDKRPSYWDATDDDLYLYPMPSLTGDTIKIIATETIAGLASGSTLVSVPEELRPPIVKYAIWRAAASLQHPLVQMFLKDYEQSIIVSLGGRVAESTNK